MIPKNVNRPLKSVSDRVQSSRSVVWALDTHDDRLNEVLAETFDELLEEGQTTPFPTQLALFRKRLVRNQEGIVTTDRAYRDQRAQESVFRGRRDALAADVYSMLVGLRQTFTGAYGEDRLAEMGFARQTPRQPAELLEHGTHLINRLMDPEIDLSGSRYGDFQIDPALLTPKVVEGLEKLRQASDALALEERKTEVLKLAKDDQLKKHNSSFLWIARTVESLLRLAGLDEVAKRVRPSTRRPGVTAKAPEQPEAGEGEVSQESSTETQASA